MITTFSVEILYHSIQSSSVAVTVSVPSLTVTVASLQIVSSHHSLRFHSVTVISSDHHTEGSVKEIGSHTNHRPLRLIVHDVDAHVAAETFTAVI